MNAKKAQIQCHTGHLRSGGQDRPIEQKRNIREGIVALDERLRIGNGSGIADGRPRRSGNATAAEADLARALTRQHHDGEDAIGGCWTYVCANRCGPHDRVDTHEIGHPCQKRHGGLPLNPIQHVNILYKTPRLGILDGAQIHFHVSLSLLFQFDKFNDNGDLPIRRGRLCGLGSADEGVIQRLADGHDLKIDMIQRTADLNHGVRGIDGSRTRYACCARCTQRRKAAEIIRIATQIGDQHIEIRIDISICQDGLRVCNRSNNGVIRRPSQNRNTGRPCFGQSGHGADDRERFRKAPGIGGRNRPVPVIRDVHCVFKLLVIFYSVQNHQS